MFEIRLNRVRDKAVFRSGKEKLKLTVDLDPRRATADLMDAGAKVADAGKAIRNGKEYEDKARDAAISFAGAIFGTEQAEKLMDFSVDANTALVAVTEYFNRRLAKKIHAAQRRVARK